MARGKKTTKPAAAENQEDEETPDAPEATAPVLILDDLGTLGVGPGGPSYVTLFERPYYAERTVTSSPRWGEKVHEAGSYGAWKSISWPAGKFPIANAIMTVANRLMNSDLEDVINKGGDLDMLADRLEKRMADMEKRVQAWTKDIKL